MTTPALAFGDLQDMAAYAFQTPVETNAVGTSAQRNADRALYQTVILNVCLAVIFVILFSFLRKRFKSFYEPLSIHYDDLIPPPGTSVFGWVKASWAYDELKLLKTHGLDHVIYLKYVTGMLTALGIMLLFGICVLIPIDATGNNRYLPSSNLNHTSGTAVISMANINQFDPADRWRLLAHLASLLFNSAVVFTVLYTTYRQYLLYRIVVKSRSRSENYSILLRGVGKQVSLETVYEFFNDIFPDQVMAVHRVPVLTSARKTLARKANVSEAIEINELERRDTGHRPTVRIGPSWLGPLRKVCLCLPKVDAIHYLMEVDTELGDGLLNSLESPEATEYAFVTFKHILTARACSQIMLSHNIDDCWLVRPAPVTDDVAWDNYSISSPMRTVRRVFVAFLAAVLIVFWSVPAAFAVSLANLSTLASLPAFSWLEVLKEYPILGGFIEGYLPVLVSFLFVQLGLIFLQSLTRMEGHLSRSGEDKSAFNKYAGFEMLNIFLVSILAGSFLGIVLELEEIAQHLGYLLDLLASKIPAQVNFFISYIATLSVLTHILELLRPFSLCMLLLKKAMGHTTSRRQQRALTRPPHLDLATVLSTDILVFAITLAYSSISAIILLFGTVYFVLALVVMRYNLVFVYRQQHQGLGKIWPSIFHWTMISVMVYQSVLVGMFVLNGFGLGVVVGGLCLISSITFWTVIHHKFFRRSKYAPLDHVQPIVLYRAGDPEDSKIMRSEGILDLETAYIDPLLRMTDRASEEDEIRKRCPETDSRSQDDLYSIPILPRHYSESTEERTSEA